MNDSEKLKYAKEVLLEIINSAILMEQDKINGLNKIFMWVELDTISIEEAILALKNMLKIDIDVE